jgi:hypothetical protein
MGKSILIVVLGMSVIVGFFILKLNANSKENLSTTVNMFEQTQARLISNSGVEIYLEKLKNDITMLGNTYYNNNLFGGTYDINISGPDSEVVVTSTATFMGVTHTSIVKAAADKLPVFPVPGAMYIDADAINKVKITGSITVSGYDHDINGNPQDSEDNDLPGIAVTDPSHIDIIEGNIGGSATVEGTGGDPSIESITTGINWEEYAEDVESDPDIIINSSTNLNNIPNLGTTASPKSTFVNGDITFNKNLEGCGILVVNGNLTINGNFTYRGIVIAYQNSTITTKLNGNGQVYGAMIVAGSSANLEISSGNFSLLYSWEALNHIKGLLTARRFNILSWWE